MWKKVKTLLLNGIKCDLIKLKHIIFSFTGISVIEKCNFSLNFS